jgi:hypothetical protein
MKSMMFMHLDLTAAEAVARKNADYAGDVIAYDRVHLEILDMSDMLTEVVTRQFPSQFNGCPLSTPVAGVQAMLHQNVPNPFVNNTTISFSIPETAARAQLMIFDDRGNIVKTFNLSQRGAGTINFDGGNLRHGVFTYSIIIDGKVADTRKMLH